MVAIKYDLPCRNTRMVLTCTPRQMDMKSCFGTLNHLHSICVPQYGIPRVNLSQFLPVSKSKVLLCAGSNKSGVMTESLQLQKPLSHSSSRTQLTLAWVSSPPARHPAC